jgi:single-strand DNA-binding protein
MKDVNKIILMGRLGADPVQRETKNGLSVVNFPLATARKVREGSKSEEGEEVLSEETQWHRVVAWGKQGEACAQYLKKGQPVFVEGMLRSRKYEGTDGASRLSFEVHAENVSFLGGMAKPHGVPSIELN